MRERILDNARRSVLLASLCRTLARAVSVFLAPSTWSKCLALVEPSTHKMVNSQCQNEGHYLDAFSRKLKGHEPLASRASQAKCSYSKRPSTPGLLLDTLRGTLGQTLHVGASLTLSFLLVVNIVMSRRRAHALVDSSKETNNLGSSKMLRQSTETRTPRKSNGFVPLDYQPANCVW